MNLDLDQWFQPRGKCFLCGEDARHRLWDAIKSRHVAGDTVDDLAFDYGLPPEAIEAVVSTEGLA